MKIIHLTDQQLEQFIMEPSACNDTIVRHLQHCPRCQNEADSYRVFFRELSHQKEESFDFDLSTLVLTQLKREQPVRASGSVTFTLCILLLIGVGVPLLYFSVISIVNPNRTGTIFPWLITCSVFLILMGFGLDNYRIYQKRLLQLP